MSQCRVILFGDPQGIPQLLASLGRHATVLAIAQASIRPGQNAELQALATEVQAPLLVQPSWRDGAYGGFVTRLKSLEPDLFVINSYAMILPPDLLGVPRCGAVNIHGALLPYYRGANVTEWALINEERTSGVTMHVVDAGIDTGPIVAQATVPIDFIDTWSDVRQRINEATRELLALKMPAVLSGRFQAMPQGEGRHWPRRSAKDGQFEWSLPLRQIYNLVRALVAPHPGAFWRRPDGATTTLDRWASLAELAALKADQLGPWHYNGLVLSPRVADPGLPRGFANARIEFDLLDAVGATIGSAALRGIDCYLGSAGGKLRCCGAVADRAMSALACFLQDELRIANLNSVEVAS